MLSEPTQIQFINPDGLNKNPAFTNVVAVTGPVKTVYIGGQDAIDSLGNIIGKGDILPGKEGDDYWWADFNVMLQKRWQRAAQTSAMIDAIRAGYCTIEAASAPPMSGARH